MKRFIHFFSAIIIFSMILSACSQAATPSQAATEAPAIELQPSNVPATPAPVLDTPTAELITVNLAGPPMEVGSKYTYVDGSVLAAVPGGTFIMGYDTIDNPIKEISVGDFWIYSSEVTNQQFALCVNSGKCATPTVENNPLYGDYHYINFPVTGVNYEQSAAYCEFVHGRLPTEAEWEKAARGPEGNIFPWGDAGPICDLLNYNFCKGKTTAIQSYPDGVSYYGIFDMAGNVREWVADWYSPTYYNEGSAVDPLGPELGDKRSVRSSSFQDSADSAISAHRFSLNPATDLVDLGFRCVVEDPTYFAPMCSISTGFGYGPDGEPTGCQPTVNCNKVSIKQGVPSCYEGQEPFTIVSFLLSDTPPNDKTFDASGCTPLGGDKFECSPGEGPASAQGSCEISGDCAQGCPAHYILDGKTCKWDGSGTSGTQCIAGQTYDPVNLCCSAAPGSAADFNICPDGTYPFNGACVKSPTELIDVKFENVQFNYTVCGTNGGGTTCDPLTDPNCNQACPPPQVLVCTPVTNGGPPKCYCR